MYVYLGFSGISLLSKQYSIDIKAILYSIDIKAILWLKATVNASNSKGKQTVAYLSTGIKLNLSI